MGVCTCLIWEGENYLNDLRTSMPERWSSTMVQWFEVFVLIWHPSIKKKQGAQVACLIVWLGEAFAWPNFHCSQVMNSWGGQWKKKLL